MRKFLPITLMSALVLSSAFADEDEMTPKEISLTPSPEKKAARKSPPTVKAAFSPFTGKVAGDKVRMRLQPDLDGYIVRELYKNQLISVTDQEGDFYVIDPPDTIKAYVFRSFILDGIVEGNRVNVRLEPDLEAPVIGHLNSGDQVTGEVSSINKKWLEIAPPSTTHFYVAKDFIEFAGGPELKLQAEKRKETVAQLQEAAQLYSEQEMEKPFEGIEFERIKQGFLTIINEYADFPKEVEKAKGALASMQESYLQKRIEYLENKASLVSSISQPQAPLRKGAQLPLQSWAPIEQALYDTWAAANDSRDKQAFYEEQKLVATSITGVVEAFKSPVKNKPGDYIVKNKNLPVAYVYSTNLDLDDYVGKEVTLIGSERDNHSFAFPAYYVHEVE